MPNIAKETVGLQNLLTNAKAAGPVPGLDVHIPELDQVLADITEMNARLENRKAVKQDETKERKVLLARAGKLAARVRAALKAHFGTDSERLVEFGARPIRSRKKAVTPDTPGPAPQTPAPAPTGTV